MTCRKATEALIHRLSNYSDLLPEIPRYCCPLVIYKRYDSNLELLAKTTKQGKCRKVSFPRTQQNGASGF